MKLTKNFTVAEMTCKCGCGQYISDDVFMECLQSLRNLYGNPMIITSGYRCPTYNDSVSSTGKTGPHTKAAVDVSVSGEDAFYLVSLALMTGFTGVGVKQKGSGRFVHLDRLIENRPRIWSY